MPYSQVRAMLAITKASLRAITRSPSAVIFSFIFPFIFIIVFGFIGNGGAGPSFNIVLARGADTSNALFTALKNTAGVHFVQFGNDRELSIAQQKGNIAGIVNIQKTTSGAAPYSVRLTSTTSSNDKWPQLQTLLQSEINTVSNGVYKDRPAYASFDFNAARDIAQIRAYRTIDFILPGQLGFSLLSAGVFGVAFMFFNLRSTLVLKRFFATPISRAFILLGEALSRVIFQMITAVVIIGVGYLFFDFTLVHGFITFVELLFLSFVGLLVFMGFGFIVSGVAKNDSAIPPFANLITLPQFLLCGTFFSIDNFPKWLQGVANILPLTHLNTLFRSVAFEGDHFWNVTFNMKVAGLNWNVPEIVILLVWGIVVYIFAVKLFKWE